ncbi:MAG: DUF3298 domain-containing protein [Clostridia bacterium]|jgi:hypothetical protein|nr:DUF3298 domain-containing protein [Clostridia bacterium]
MIKKKNFYLTFIIILIFSVLVGVVTLKIFPEPTTEVIWETINLSLKEGEPLVMGGSYETKQLYLSDPYIDFEVKYPYFKNADIEFNLSIENFLKEQIENDKLIVKENWQARYGRQAGRGGVQETPQGEEKFSFYSNYTIVQSNSYFISFFLTYGAFSSMAHGYEVNKSYNYDLRSNSHLTLAQLYKGDEKYLERLSQKSRDILKKQYAVVSDEDKKNLDLLAIDNYLENINNSIDIGTEPTKENFKIFTFTPNTIKIYFDQYQFGPYVAGIPKVEINTYSIVKVIKRFN